jgi:Ca2+-binding RTX toxin-like protein
MLVPHGTVEDVSNSPELLRGARVPFFSTQTAQGQMVDLTGNGNTFAWEDLPINGDSDRDYNDLIFRMTGAIGATAAVDDWINPDKDWRPSDLGEELLDYATTGQTAIPAPPTVPNPTNWSIRAWAMDGYIANAEVFFDANKNGVRDDNEPTATTDEEGLLDLDLSLTEFDTNGNGQLDPEEGHIMVVGGTDTANGLPLETPLKATPDAAVINLLTSLVADLIDLGLSPLEANDQVKQVLSLPDNVDLTSFDPIAATDEQLVGGVETNLAMVQLQNLITQTVGLISGAATLDKTQITLSVVNSLASDIIDQATLDLTSADQLQPLIEAAAQKIAAIDSSLDLDQVLQATAGAATVMASANQALAEAVANGDTGVNEAIAIVQKVSLDITTQELTAVGAQELSIEEAIANNTGDTLSDRIYDSSDIDESGGNGIFPVSPNQVPPFTSLSSILPSDESNNTSLSVPPAIPSEPTVDLINISFTAIGTDSAENIDATPNNDVISGQGGDDIIRGLPGNDALFGNDGNDELYGNQGADLLLGNQGKDSIYGGQGNDLAMGGRDNDLIYGDLGSDTLIGDIGDDTLFGGTSNPGSVASDAGDLLFGKDGNDFLHGNAGDDSISGGNDNDTARGGQGDDLIHGDAGNDILHGDKGDDSLAGDTENDLLYGGEGNDILWGGDGGDFLFGGEGDDALIGGTGKDYFVLQSSFGSDTIVDFTDGNDLIGLIGGLTFDQLNITGSNGNTLIASGNELLATLTGIDVGLITSADFTLMA